jgi:hypothetical protein
LIDFCFLNISEGWFTVDEKPPVALVKLEILEGADMKPSDPNGILLSIKFISFLIFLCFVSIMLCSATSAFDWKFG